jgi:hypothetical protein
MTALIDPHSYRMLEGAQYLVVAKIAMIEYGRLEDWNFIPCPEHIATHVTVEVKHLDESIGVGGAHYTKEEFKQFFVLFRKHTVEDIIGHLVVAVCADLKTIGLLPANIRP